MAKNAHELFDNILECCKMRGNYRHKRHLKQFPPSGPFVFVTMDILEPLQMTSTGDQFVIVMTERYSKLTISVPVWEKTGSNAALTLAVNWSSRCGILNILLMDNRPQFASKFFNTLSSPLGGKQLTTMTYHLQTKGQTKR